VGARDLKLQGKFDYAAIIRGFDAVIPKAREFESLIGTMNASGAKGQSTMQMLALATVGETNATYKATAANDGFAKSEKEVARQSRSTSEEMSRGSKKRAAAKGEESAAVRQTGLAVAEEKRAIDARTAAYEEWLRKVNSTPVKIHMGPNQRFRDEPERIGPPRPSPKLELPASKGPDGQVSHAYNVALEQAERDKAAILRRGLIERAGIRAQEPVELSKEGKALLALDKKIGMARAHEKNNQFDRDIQKLRAEGTYLLKIHKGNAEATLKVQEFVAERYRAIESRRANFGNTPFQKHLGVMTQMLGKLGVSAKQSGYMVQQMGYQVGDFAVQVGSGQGVMRPFLQQFTQMVQFFGPWGSAIGAGTAILGALTIGLIKAKKASEELKDTTLPEWLQPGALAKSAQELDKLAISQAKLFAGSIAGPGVEELRNAVRTSVTPMEQYAASLGAVSDATGTLNRLNAEGVNKLTGYSDAVYSAMQRANSRQLDAESGLRRAIIEGREEGLKKQKDLAVEGYNQERRRIEDHHKAILASTKSTPEEKAASTRALDEKDANSEISLLRKTHNQEMSNLEKDSGRKQAEEKRKAKDLQQTNIRLAHDKERAEAIAHQERMLAVERSHVDRRMEALGASQEAMLLTRQAREQEDIQRQAAALDMVLLSSLEKRRAYEQQATDLTAVHEAERAALTKKTYEENAQKIAAANGKIIAGAMTLGNEFANTFNIGPMQKALAALQRILAVIEAMRAVSAGINTLKALGGLGSILAAPATGGASMLGFGALSAVAEKGGRVPLPQYGDGGPIRKYPGGGAIYGPRHSAGGVPIEAEGDEHILDRDDVRNFGGHRALYAMRSAAARGVFKPTANRQAGGGGYSGNRAVTFAPVLNIQLSGTATAADAQRVVDATIPALRKFATEQSNTPFYRAQGEN
jgi:hypothetical protein